MSAFSSEICPIKRVLNLIKGKLITYIITGASGEEFSLLTDAIEYADDRDWEHCLISVKKADGECEVLTREQISAIRDYEAPIIERQQLLQNINCETEEDLEELVDMYCEKMSRDGRVTARGGVEISEKELKYMVTRQEFPEFSLKPAMEWIRSMSRGEFQQRLIDGTMPEFPRDRKPMLIRDTCHSRRLMTPEELQAEAGDFENAGNINRDALAYMSLADFKSRYYDEFYMGL